MTGTLTDTQLAAAAGKTIVDTASVAPDADIDALFRLMLENDDAKLSPAEKAFWEKIAPNGALTQTTMANMLRLAHAENTSARLASLDNLERREFSTKVLLGGVSMFAIALAALDVNFSYVFLKEASTRLGELQVSANQLLAASTLVIPAAGIFAHAMKKSPAFKELMEKVGPVMAAVTIASLGVFLISQAGKLPPEENAAGYKWLKDFLSGAAQTKANVAGSLPAAEIVGDRLPMGDISLDAAPTDGVKGPALKTAPAGDLQLDQGFGATTTGVADAEAGQSITRVASGYGFFGTASLTITIYESFLIYQAYRLGEVLMGSKSPITMEAAAKSAPLVRRGFLAAALGIGTGTAAHLVQMKTGVDPSLVTSALWGGLAAMTYGALDYAGRYVSPRRERPIPLQRQEILAATGEKFVRRLHARLLARVAMSGQGGKGVEALNKALEDVLDDPSITAQDWAVLKRANPAMAEAMMDFGKSVFDSKAAAADASMAASAKRVQAAIAEREALAEEVKTEQAARAAKLPANNGV